MVGVNVTDIAHSPTLTETQLDGAVAVEKICDVIGLILDALVIAGPTGSENTLANTCAVYIKSVDSESRSGRGSLLYLFVCLEAFLKCECRR